MNCHEYLNQFLGQYPDSRTLSDGIEVLKEEYYAENTGLTLPEFIAIVDGAEYHRKLMFALELDDQSKNTELKPFWAKFSEERIAIQKANIYASAKARRDLPGDRSQKFRARLAELGYPEIANRTLVHFVSPD